MQAADQLVAAFRPMPSSANTPVAAELAAIHNALAAVCAERYDEAAEWIRPIPYSSLFRHWKLYIKGLVAFHRGDTQRAMQTLSEVPPDTTPGRASLPYLYWLNGSSGGTRLENRVNYSNSINT